MKCTLVAAMAAMLTGSLMAQSDGSFRRVGADQVTTKDAKPHVQIPSLAKALSITSGVANGYVAGATHNLYITLVISNEDGEYADSLSLTFPAGITVNSVSNDDIFGPGDGFGDPEAFNGISGQTVSWGDNDNDYGGIVSGGTAYSFQVNATFDAGLSGEQIIEAFASGDEFGPDPADFSFEIAVSPIANEAQLQVIHNSADAAAAEVDVRVNGNIPDASLDDLAFRNASPFLTVPATTDLEVTVNPPSSTDASGSLFTQTFNLDPGISYVVVADGIVSATGYTPATDFSLEAFAPAAQITGDPEVTAVLVHHGSTDAPTVDVLEPGLEATLVDDISYPEFQGPLGLPTADYTLQITTADNSAVVANYSAPLATLDLGGTGITVLASGFLDPGSNSDGPAFGLWVALPSGGALVELPLADVAVANDAPCDALPLTAGEVTLGSNTFATADADEVAPISGVCDGSFSWCDGTEGELAVVDNSMWYTFVAPESGVIELSTCAAETDFDTQIAVYSATSCDDYTSFTLVGANDDFFGEVECAAASLFASRFTVCNLTPGEIYHVQVDGYDGDAGTFGLVYTPLDASACTARLQVVHNSPDAAAAVVDVRVNGDFPAADYDDLAFRNATATIDAPAGVPLDITINAPGSTDASDPILLLEDVVLNPGSSYQVVAQGLVSATGYTPPASEVPLELISIEGYLESNPSPNNVFIAVSHGATDAPAVDVNDQFGSLGTIIADLPYGGVDGYVDAPAENLVLSITPAGSSTIVASFDAPLADLGLGGDAITVFASGFLDPAQNSEGPAFGLWVSLPAGGELIPLDNVTSVEEVESLDRLSMFPNPASNRLSISYELNTSSDVAIDIVDITGKVVRGIDLGRIGAGQNLQQIDLSDLSQGLYIVNMTINGQQVAEKIQVLR